MSAVVTVENLSKHYGRHRAVDDVSFTIERGDVLGLLGPNGSGKTTILRILTGYLHASAGRVTVAGFDVVDDGIEARRRIGYVPENAPLYAHMRVIEAMLFMGQLKGLQGRALTSAVDDAVERLSLGPVRTLAVSKLSRGYRQRVAIAQALLNKPDLLVLDEPTNGLDPRQIIELRRLIGNLAAEHTILVTSHILAEMERVATQVAILLDGRLLAVRSLKDSKVYRVRLRIESQSPEAVIATLHALDGVRQAQLSERCGTGEAQYLVEGHSAAVAAELVPALLHDGHHLLEMTEVSQELEALFLSLTERSGA